MTPEQIERKRQRIQANRTKRLAVSLSPVTSSTTTVDSPSGSSLSNSNLEGYDKTNPSARSADQWLPSIPPSQSLPFDPTSRPNASHIASLFSASSPADEDKSESTAATISPSPGSISTAPSTCPTSPDMVCSQPYRHNELMKELLHDDSQIDVSSPNFSRQCFNNPSISIDMLPEEQAKLGELDEAAKAMIATSRSDATEITLAEMLERGSLKVVKFVKRLSSFKLLNPEDQIVLLKEAASEMLLWMSFMFFDPKSDSWPLFPASKRVVMKYKIHMIHSEKGSLLKPVALFVLYFVVFYL